VATGEKTSSFVQIFWLKKNIARIVIAYRRFPILWWWERIKILEAARNNCDQGVLEKELELTNKDFYPGLKKRDPSDIEVGTDFYWFLWPDLIFLPNGSVIPSSRQLVHKVEGRRRWIFGWEIITAISMTFLGCQRMGG